MIIVIGVAGGGKSTQCKMLKDSGKFQWLSVGQFLREHVTDPIKKAAMLAGDMLDEGYVTDVVNEEINRLGDSPELIIDGFPRSTSEADWLISLHKSSKLNISHIVHLTADEDIAKSRLELRSRDDDTEAAIAERFHDYRESILPITKHFADAGLKVVEVDGQMSVEEVHNNLLEAIGSK
jgi:adenylate kinase